MGACPFASRTVTPLRFKFSTRLFAESTLDIISSGEAIDKVDKKFQDALIAIQSDFLQCRCQDRPFCSCLQRGISELIVHERLKGKDPQDISTKLFRKYQVQVYPGDIFSWLDNFVKNLDAIKRIAKAYNKNNILSIPLTMYEFTGGAHGLTNIKSFNYDLATGKELKLEDLFKFSDKY